MTYAFDTSEDVSPYRSQLSKKGNDVLFSGNINVEANTINLVIFDLNIPEVTSTQSLDLVNCDTGSTEA
ncbi:MAG: hypothetical protein ACI9HG_000776 [Flavobacteriales bacterium]|jgi:hypothetical protein